MNEIQQTRTPEIIGTEIRTIMQQANYMALVFGVEIGRRLTEAKAMLKHGEWLPWLERETGFSASRAHRFMLTYNKYGADQGSLFGSETNLPTLANISVSNALRLLAVPEEEREEFALANDVEHMSARELDRLIKERDEARKAQAEAERERTETAEELEELNHNYTALNVVTKELRDTANAAEKNAEKERQEKAARERELMAAQGKLRSLEKENRELRARPVEVAVQIDEKAVKDAAAKARAETEKEWRKKLEAAEKALKAMEGRTDEAGEREKEELRAQLEETRKQLQLSNPQAAAFKVHFEAMQLSFSKLSAALHELEKAEPETAQKFQGAVKALAAKMMEVLG